MPPAGDLPDPGTEPESYDSCIGRWVLSHQCHLGSLYILTHTHIWTIKIEGYLYVQIKFYGCLSFFLFIGCVCTGPLLLCAGFLQLWYVGFSLWWLLLWSTGSRACAQQLWPQTQLLLCMRNLPGAGIEPMSPALVGRLLTTGPVIAFSLGQLSPPLIFYKCLIHIPHIQIPPVDPKIFSRAKLS